MSGGELSTAVDRVEERLNNIFELTKRWNAVSLLDEADVLLCKRNSAEMDRNAVVAGMKCLTIFPITILQANVRNVPQFSSGSLNIFKVFSF